MLSAAYADVRCLSVRHETAKHTAIVAMECESFEWYHFQ